MWTDVLAYLLSVQTTIREAIAGDIRAFTVGRNWSALLAVLPLGAVFGAVHALTPGHSKMVLATYLAGSPLRVIQGIGVALALSLTHILSAVAIAWMANQRFLRGLRRTVSGGTCRTRTEPAGVVHAQWRNLRRSEAGGPISRQR